MHMMPREGPSAAGMRDMQENSFALDKPSICEDRIDVDVDYENEETIEEEVEYEEVVEEVEEEEEIEEEVEEEEEIEEEYEEHEMEERKNVEDENEAKMRREFLSLPPHGSEVYLGGIPHDVSEIELREFCKPVGEVTEVRIMKGKDSSEGKGYAFVTFKNKDLALKAIEELNNTEFMGKKIKCSTSQANHRLFIGNVPRNWEERDMSNTVKRIGPGVVGVELLKDPQNSSRNRGFAFIEYYNHACAEYSRKKMLNPDFKLDVNAPTVSWADPKNGGSSSASQVKAIYVKNLPRDITQDRVKQLFEHHGKVTKVVLPPAKPGHENSRYGFVHFSERSNAMKALKNTEKYELDGQVLDCSLAKPQAEQKPSNVPNSQKSAVHSSLPPRLGYGLVGPSYGALGRGYPGTALAPPMIYGGGANHANMSMMPMLLPDGRIGYVLQQPRMQPHATPLVGRGGARSSSIGSRRGIDSRGRNRYNPY